jgi:hypothetical protein
MVKQLRRHYGLYRFNSCGHEQELQNISKQNIEGRPRPGKGSQGLQTTSQRNPGNGLQKTDG